MRRLGWTIALVSMWGCGDDGAATPGTDTETEDGSSSGTATTVTTPGSSESSSSSTLTGADSSSSSGDTGSSGESSGSSSSGSGSDSSSDGSSSGSSSSSSGESSTTDIGVVTESSSGDPSSEETGLVFILEPDAGVSESCSTFEDECPDGEKCNAFADNGGSSWNALGCFPLDAAPGAEGEPCTVEDSGVSGTDSCGQGLMCWGVDTETNIGYCIAFCEGTPDAPTCANGSDCVFTNEVLNLCLAPCDPLAQDCPVPSELCVPLTDDFVCAPDASGGLGFAGDPCEFVNVCALGLFCGAADLIPGCAGSSGCCTPFCDVTSPTANADCAGDLAGTECVPFFAEGSAPPGLEDVGSCFAP